MSPARCSPRSRLKHGGGGYRELRLETGLKQPEAIALYQSAGFELIPCWGIYAQLPLSRCFAKRLV